MKIYKNFDEIRKFEELLRKYYENLKKIDQF